jgi:hypothetical protein
MQEYVTRRAVMTKAMVNPKGINHGEKEENTVVSPHNMDTCAIVA